MRQRQLNGKFRTTSRFRHRHKTLLAFDGWSSEYFQKYFDQAAKHREEKVKEFEKLPEAKKQQLIEEAQQKKEKRAETSEKIAKHKVRIDLFAFEYEPATKSLFCNIKTLEIN